jgi:hypothetical protein
MSRVLDFRDLRERILAGEEEEFEEEVDSPLQIEGREAPTLVPFALSVGLIGFWFYDTYLAEGSAVGEGTKRMILTTGVISAGFGLGRLTRGLTAQDQNERYERLLDEADAKIEELEKEAQEAEEEKEAEQEAENESNSYHFDYLSAEDSSYHIPTIGGVSAFGQEGVIFRPPIQESLW